MDPGYIDLTYNEEKKRYVILLSENPLTLLNFDLFLPTSILLTMYYLENLQLTSLLKIGNKLILILNHHQYGELLMNITHKTIKRLDIIELYIHITQVQDLLMI